jgi:hypothetical protein
MIPQLGGIDHADSALRYLSGGLGRTVLASLEYFLQMRVGWWAWLPALHYAADAGHIGVVRLLLPYLQAYHPAQFVASDGSAGPWARGLQGVDELWGGMGTEARDVYNNTALIYAARQGHG